MNIWLDADLGSGNAGKTVEYRLYDIAGASVVAWTSASVVEVGNGVYGILLSSIPNFVIGIQWRTVEATPAYAAESLDMSRDVQTMLKTILYRRKWDVTQNTLTVYEEDGLTPFLVFSTDADLHDITPAM